MLGWIIIGAVFVAWIVCAAFVNAREHCLHKTYGKDGDTGGVCCKCGLTVPMRSVPEGPHGDYAPPAARVNKYDLRGVGPCKGQKQKGK